MALNQLKQRMREHQAEMKRRSEQRKDARELRRNQRLTVDLEPMLGSHILKQNSSSSIGSTSPSSKSLTPQPLKWEDYKDSLQQFYDDRGTFDDEVDDEIPEEFRKHQTETSDLSQLPEEFFQESGPNFDVVDHVLSDIPDHLSVDSLVPHIQSKIEQSDIFRDRVSQDLTAVVMEKYDTFVAGMQTVKDIDLDLSKAVVYATNSRRLLATCKTDLVTSTLQVIQRQRTLQRILIVDEMVKVLQRAQALRSTMQKAVEKRRFADAVTAYTHAHKELQAEHSKRLSAVNAIRNSLPQYAKTLHETLNAELRLLCFEGFHSSKYEAVIKAYILLDEHAQHLLESQVAECVDEPVPLTVSITCPERMSPGDKVTVRTAEGRKFAVKIPPGTEPGKQFRVTMPLSQSDRAVMSIRCPSSAKPGQRLKVTTTKGQKVQAIVPEDATPGTKFFIRIPKAERSIESLGGLLEGHLLDAATTKISEIVREVVRLKWRELRRAGKAQRLEERRKAKAAARLAARLARADAAARRKKERQLRKEEKKKNTKKHKKVLRRSDKNEIRPAKKITPPEAPKRAANPYLVAANATRSAKGQSSRPRGDSANPFSSNPFGDDDSDDNDDQTNPTMSTNPFGDDVSSNPFGDDEEQDNNPSNPFGADDESERAAVQNPFASDDDDDGKTVSQNPFADEDDDDEIHKHKIDRQSSNPFGDDDDEDTSHHQTDGSTNPFGDSKSQRDTANPFDDDDDDDDDNRVDTRADNLDDSAVSSSSTDDEVEEPDESSASEQSDEVDSDDEHLQSQTLRELASMLHAAALPAALGKVYGGMWQLLHSHFLFLQWHRDPFSTHNNDIAYLHRAAEDQDPEPKHDLAVVVRDLKSAGVTLWRACQQSVAQFIECLSLRQKDFQNLVVMSDLAAITGIFVLIGNALNTKLNNPSTDTASKSDAEGTSRNLAKSSSRLGSLEITVRNKLSHFFIKEVHETSFRTLTEGLQREEWNLLPIDLESMGGLETIVLHRLTGAVQGCVTSQWQQLFVLFEEAFWLPALPSQANSELSFSRHGVVPEKSLENYPKFGIPFDLQDGTYQIDASALSAAQGLIASQLGVPTSNGNATTDAAAERFATQLQSEYNKLHSILPSSTGTITSSGLNLFAQFAGKYYHCIRLMPQIAQEAFGHLVELFDYYLYAVFMTFFLEDAHELIWDAELQVTDPQFKPLIEYLRRQSQRFDSAAIEANLQPPNELMTLIDGMKLHKDSDSLKASSSTIMRSTSGPRQTSSRVKKKEHRVPSAARLPFNPKLSVEATMWGINARSVAVESILFLVDVMWFLRPRLQCFLGTTRSVNERAGHQMQEFYEATPGLVAQYRHYFYRSMAVTMCMVGRERVPIHELVEKTSWTNTSDMLECNSYVKKVLQQMEGLWIRLDALSKDMPPLVAETMWAHCYEQVLMELMEGFASVRKCNPSGRGMMKMDLTAIVRGIKKIHPVDLGASTGTTSGSHDDGTITQVSCTQESIDSYINAFYFDSRADLMEWIENNVSNYYERWMVGLALVGVGAKMRPHEKDKLKKDVIALFR